MQHVSRIVLTISCTRRLLHVLQQLYIFLLRSHVICKRILLIYKFVTLLRTALWFYAMSLLILNHVMFKEDAHYTYKVIKGRVGLNFVAMEKQHSYWT